MCARVAQFVLAAIFVFVVATVAAFRYLAWWQAILASAATFLALVYAARWLVVSAVRGFGKGLFDTKSRVLRGATVQVHGVRPADPPAAAVDAPADAADDDPDEAARRDELRARAWYEIELTLFPDPAAAGPMTHWDLDDLRLVPVDAAPPSADGDGEGDGPGSELWHVRVVADGVAVEPEGSKLRGPHRLRFVAGLPAGVREAAFHYYFERFGRIPLTPTRPAIN